MLAPARNEQRMGFTPSNRTVVDHATDLANQRRLPVNHTKAIQVRAGPIDPYLYWLAQTGHPEIIGQEANHKRIQKTFTEVQQDYAAALIANPARINQELFSTQSRSKKIFRDQNTVDSLPVFTHGSDWFKRANESNHARYGKSRLSLFPDRMADPRSHF